MRYLFPALIALPLLCLNPVWADDNPSSLHQAREAYARDFAQSVVTILHDPAKPYGARQSTLRRAFEGSVDTDWMAKFALGPSWRQMTDEQRERYVSLYRKYLTETYVGNFAENSSRSIYAIKILGIADEERDGFVVHTSMQMMSNNKLHVDYRVSDRQGHYRVRDIVIENVSLIATHRSEFSELAAQQGIDGVIATLEERLSDKLLTLSMK